MRTCLLQESHLSLAGLPFPSYQSEQTSGVTNGRTSRRSDGVTRTLALSPYLKEERQSPRQCGAQITSYHAAALYRTLP